MFISEFITNILFFIVFLLFLASFLFGVVSVILFLDEAALCPLSRPLDKDKLKNSRLLGKFFYLSIFFYLFTVEFIFDIFIGIPFLLCDIIWTYSTHKDWSFAKCVRIKFGVVQFNNVKYVLNIPVKRVRA